MSYMSKTIVISATNLQCVNRVQMEAFSGSFEFGHEVLEAEHLAQV